jgi:hypothetical protein
VIRVAGVELAAHAARVVAFDAWRSQPRVLELDWDPARPEALVAQLRERLGPARRVALSIGLGFLHPKHVKLPPAPAVERRRMLTLEPDRFFPVLDQPVAVSLIDAEDFAFAADAETIEGWTRAFEDWAPVDNVEAAPVSLARALGRMAEGTFALPAAPGEHGIVELHHGRVRSARRVSRDAAMPEASAVPNQRGVPAAFLCALGAARGMDVSTVTMLLTGALAARIRARRRRRVLVAATICVAAAVLALASLDRSRQRTLEHIREQVADVADDARAAGELSDLLAALDQEAAALHAIEERRLDALAVLAALGELLPHEATVLNAKANGLDWQIDGRTSDAAAIVPLLAGDDRFEDVRFLAASTRFRENGRTYETFSIAFRARS